ncbi:RNA-directed DNA polymerase, eukaryota, reverse transcriptase zinc-binding domain protein [Tanacetum coccineum]
MEQQNIVCLDEANEVTCNANDANQNVVNKCNHGSSSEVKTNVNKFNDSYAKIIGNGSDLSKELLYIHIRINENGDEVVIFEEELKWDPDVCNEKANPCKILIWIKLLNVPLEAWSIRRISALASRLGKPIMMDNMIASMCHKGTGQVGYARILVEIDAKKARHEGMKGKGIMNELIYGKEGKRMSSLKSGAKGIMEGLKPNDEVTKKWTYDMKRYFKYRWEALNRGYGDSDEENDVLEMKDDTINSLIAEEINGNDTQLLN